MNKIANTSVFLGIQNADGRFFAVWATHSTCTAAVESASTIAYR